MSDVCRLSSTCSLAAGERVIVSSGVMEHMLQRRRRRRGGTWDKRMEGVMVADLGCFVEEDVEVEFGSERSVKADMGVTLANLKTLDSDGCSDRKKLDLFAITEPAELRGTKEQKEGDGGSQTGANAAVSVKHRDAEPKMDVESEETNEDESDEGVRLCSGPGEGSECQHVRIPLQEVESFYRLSCRCHWICGGFLMIGHFNATQNILFTP